MMAEQAEGFNTFLKNT